MPLPKKKAPAEEYADFLKAISGDVREVDRRLEEEASEAALERTQRDAFEQRYAGAGAEGSGLRSSGSLANLLRSDSPCVPAAEDDLCAGCDCRKSRSCAQREQQRGLHPKVARLRGRRRAQLDGTAHQSPAAQATGLWGCHRLPSGGR